MSLRKITIPKREVSINGEQKFTVGGISANQLFGIYNRHREQLSDLYDRFAGRSDAASNEIVNSVEGIIAQFPTLVGEAIAIAAGGDPSDEENWLADMEVATSLSMPVQVDALMKIGELTFSPDMPPKKFFALLVGMIQQLNGTTVTVPLGSES